MAIAEGNKRNVGSIGDPTTPANVVGQYITISR
mgnify:CR=1 FL=1